MLLSVLEGVWQVFMRSGKGHERQGTGRAVMRRLFCSGRNDVNYCRLKTSLSHLYVSPLKPLVGDEDTDTNGNTSCASM